jgi:hypothetical protein
MVSMLASSVVDRGFEPRSGQTKDYKIRKMCPSEATSICGLLFQWANTIKKNPTQRVGLEQRGPHHHLIEN